MPRDLCAERGLSMIEIPKHRILEACPLSC